MSSAAPYWVLQPALRCVSFVTEEAKNASTVFHAVYALANLETILWAAGELLRRAGQSDVDVNKLILANQTLGKWAKALVQDDYHAVTVHATIGFWTAVEVAVEDTASLVLVNDPRAVRDIATAGLRVRRPVPLNEDDARVVYRNLEHWARTGRAVADGYAHLLAVLGVKITLTPEVVVTLSELNAVRNCLLHRGGVVDDKAVREAPRLRGSLGQNIRISDSQSQQYFAAVCKFTDALIVGATASRHHP